MWLKNWCHCNASLCQWKPVSNHYMWTWVAKQLTTKERKLTLKNTFTSRFRFRSQYRKNRKQLQKISLKSLACGTPANAFVDRRKMLISLINRWMKMLEHAGRTRRRKMRRSVKNACKNVYKNVTLASKILRRWAAMVKKHLKCHTYHWGYVKKLRLLTPNKISFGDTSKMLRGACPKFSQKSARF